MKTEHQLLLDAYNETQHKWSGAMELREAIYEHLSGPAQLAASQAMGQLHSAHLAASAALDAYHARPVGTYAVVGEAYQLAA